jgi:hypothetical protein
MGNQRVPKPLMMSTPTFPEGISSPPEPPDDLRSVVEWFLRHEDARDRFRWVLRHSLDQLLDGEHTGRWNYLHLSKTEKTHLGTIVEINLTKEFGIDDGGHLDWQVDGADLDCKFSKDYRGWEIPREMYLSPTGEPDSGTADHLALLVWMDDDRSQWAVGILRVSDDLLSGSSNRDRKRKLNDEGLAAVHWLWGGVQHDLPENTLLHMEPAARDRVFGASSRSGQKRINALFRELAGQIVGRTTVLTVAQQDDGMKRPRDARRPENLGSAGYLILGHQDASPHIARLLELPVPVKGEFVSVRVAPVGSTDPRPKCSIGGEWWAKAEPGDPVAAAPELPRKQPSAGWAAYLNASS